IIGVYEMCGIWKTTLVKEVARLARQDKLFDHVIFSEVSQTPNIKKIQGEIAEKLGLDEKKILIVLDNVWKHVYFDTVGIPFRDDHKNVNYC
ncbi:hypothetical protein CICLE_v10003906mg, partial [Citrus x clementina]